MIAKRDGIGIRESCGGQRSNARKAGPTKRVKGWAPLSSLLLGMALLGACGRASKPTAPGCCEKSGPGWTDDGGADSAPPVAAASAKPPARFRTEEGCARDFRTSGEPARDLGELERLCAQGLAPLLAATEGTRAAGAEAIEVPFRITGSTVCLRAGALGMLPGQVVTLENAQGKVLAAAASTETIALVPVDGTVCVREAGVYRLVIKPGSAAPEARTLTVQVWQASRD
ncbi:MAG TPA: hypothetical protein VK550_18560 [Polyangiaceae bacterium]|nr:hypothetical protein [Polyangiaceae bacterium]